MGIDDVKAAVRGLTVDERRSLALYILDLEKEHVQKTYGPQIVAEMENVSKVFQEGIDKLKKFVNKD
jgi:hypothetical protein